MTSVAPPRADLLSPAPPDERWQLAGHPERERAADGIATRVESRNARTASTSTTTPADPPFAERGAVEALDQTAYLFHVQTEGRRKKLVLPTDTLFSPGSDVLDPTLAPVRLRALAEALKAQGPHRIHVDSFTDALGDAAENLALSARRANALRDFFLGQGVRPERIVADGKGATRPIASNATPDGRATNRRIEIVIE